jgi:hypothetical protein
MPQRRLAPARDMQANLGPPTWSTPTGQGALGTGCGSASSALAASELPGTRRADTAASLVIWYLIARIRHADGGLYGEQPSAEGGRAGSFKERPAAHTTARILVTRRSNIG